MILHHSGVSDARLVVMGETWAHVVCSKCHVLRGSDMIGHRSAGAPDEVASWLAR